MSHFTFLIIELSGGAKLSKYVVIFTQLGLKHVIGVYIYGPPNFITQRMVL